MHLKLISIKYASTANEHIFQNLTPTFEWFMKSYVETVFGNNWIFVLFITSLKSSILLVI